MFFEVAGQFYSAGSCIFREVFIRPFGLQPGLLDSDCSVTVSILLLLIGGSF